MKVMEAVKAVKVKKGGWQAVVEVLMEGEEVKRK